MTMIAPGTLYVVSAPSGGGKTSLTRALVPRLAQTNTSAVISVSYTTRAPRAGEQDGTHYHFVGDQQFREMIGRGEFLEHAEVFGRRYGTGRAKTVELLATGTDVILDIDWQGARQVKTQMPSARGIFILPPSLTELERRLRGRGQDSDEVIERRMREAHEEMSHYDEYDYLVINEDFDRALHELGVIFAANRLRLSEQQARHCEQIAQLLDKTGPIR